MNPLTSIPPKVRLALYWTGWVLGIITQGTTVVWVAVAASSPNVTQPTWLIISSAAFGFLQTQLNLVAGVNVDQKKPRRRSVTLRVHADTSELMAALERARAEVDRIQRRLDQQPPPPRDDPLP